MPGGPYTYERTLAVHHRRREHEVRQAERVIGVQMGDEDAPQIGDPKRRDASPDAAAAVERLTIPAPASTRYDEPCTTIARPGPLRSGSGIGVPVPSSTTRARVVSAPWPERMPTRNQRGGQHARAESIA